jgi:hypothetical protein
MNAFRGVVMAFVTENTNNLSGQGFVENLDDSLTIAFVSAGHGAVQDVLTSAFADFFNVGDKCWLRFGHRLGGHNELSERLLLFLCSLNGLPFRFLLRGPAGRCCCQLETPNAVPKLNGHVDWLVAENWLKGSHKHAID